jgi:hypothetical protein
LRPFLLLIQLHGVGRLFRSEAVVDPSSGSMLVRDCDRDHAWRLRSGDPPSEPVSGGPAWARVTDAAEKRDREW